VDYIILNNWIQTEKIRPQKPELEPILMNS